MNIRELSDLTYILKNLNKHENNNLPKPIVFLGAGCSVTAGIPQAKDIVKEILKDYSEKPSVMRLKELEKNNYYQLMSALSANERREIFQKYVNSEDVKINLAHIYLAQLLHEGYVDYVFTSNFDDLLLKACSLFNFIPPVYDIANINDFTTTSFQKQSVTYLHGQHHGQWLLNAKGELEKVKPNLSSLFQRVCNHRTWIIVGYSGEDEIFNELEKFSSFDDELYWIGYKDNEPSKNVREKLLDIEHKNAYLISNYDADSFFLNLHSSLNLETPLILNKPFSFVKRMVNHIQNIDVENSTEENKEIYKAVKERYDDCNNMIDEAIDIIENFTESLLKQQIIEAILKKDYSNAETFLNLVKENNKEDEKEVLSSLYHDYGYSLIIDAEKDDNEALYIEAYEKYKISTELDNKKYGNYNNLGNVLFELGKIKNDETLFLESLQKYAIADKLKPNDSLIITNEGIVLNYLARLKKDEKLFVNAIEKYKQAYLLNPNKFNLVMNWGITLSDLAVLKRDESLFFEAVEKYNEASNLSPNNDLIINNWAITLTDFAGITKDENLYFKSIEKYEEAYKLNPKNNSLFNNWGNSLSNLALIKNNENLYLEAAEKYKLGFSLNSKDGKLMMNWATALSNLAQLKRSENLFFEAIEKYKLSNDLTPNNDLILDNYSSSLLHLYSLTKNYNYLNEALEKAKIAFDLNSEKTYNLSCCYAQLKDKENAFHYLRETLENDLVPKNHILEDQDWDIYKNDEDFINLLKQYQK